MSETLDEGEEVKIIHSQIREQWRIVRLMKGLPERRRLEKGKFK